LQLETPCADGKCDLRSFQAVPTELMSGISGVLTWMNIKEVLRMINHRRMTEMSRIVGFSDAN
jgi:hypothetical protein